MFQLSPRKPSKKMTERMKMSPFNLRKWAFLLFSLIFLNPKIAMFALGSEGIQRTTYFLVHIISLAGNSF